MSEVLSKFPVPVLMHDHETYLADGHGHSPPARTHRAVPPEVPDDAGEDGAAALHRGEVPAALARLRVVRDVLEVGPARPARPAGGAVVETAAAAAPAAATVEEAVVALLLPVGLVPAMLLLLRTCNAERR